MDHACIYLNQIEAPNFANTSVSHKYSVIFGYVTRAWAAKVNYEIELYKFEQMIDLFNKKFNGKYFISYSTMDNYFKNLNVEIRIGSSHYQKEKIIIPPTPHD